MYHKLIGYVAIICMFGATSAYAVTDDLIGENPTCDIDTLGNGDSVDLEANFEPNKITVNFYDDGEDTTPQSKTCTYDGILNLPPKPSRPGYIFAGWKLRSATSDSTYGPLCGIPNLEPGTPDDLSYAYSWINWSGKFCKVNGSLYSCNKTPDLKSAGEWKIEFSYGTLYGEVSCNETIEKGGVKTHETFTKNTTTPSGNERACWCRATGFTANPKPGETYDYSGGAQCKVLLSGWVFYGAYAETKLCADDCAIACALKVRSNPEFQETVFGAVGQ